MIDQTDARPREQSEPERIQPDQSSRIRGRRLGGYVQVLGQRNPRLLIGSGTVSEIGDWLSTVALVALAYRFGESSLSVGGLLTVRMIPRLILQGPAGALVDRWGGRRLLVASQLAMAAIATSFTLLSQFPNLWLLFGLVLAIESVNTVAMPAFRGHLAIEVAPAYRGAANGLMTLGVTTAFMVGPLIGAILMEVVGTSVLFLLNGLTFLAVAAAVSRLAGPDRQPSTNEGTATEAAADGGNAEPVSRMGYRQLLANPQLSLYAAAQCSIVLLINATVALFVVRAHALGFGDRGVGVFYATVAAGSTIGGVVAGAGSHLSRSALVLIATSFGIGALGLAWFGLAGSQVAALAALGIAGFGTTAGEVIALTFFQNRLPERVYARFFSLFLMMLAAGGLIGALLGPIAQENIGTSAALAILAAPALAAAAILGVIYRSAPANP